jgi:CheY-like chemotaxis protein
VQLHLIKPAKQSEIYDAVISSLSVSESSIQASRKQPARSAANPTRHLNVLLVEDNVVNQKLAIGILKKMGHQITIANHGLEALNLIQQNREFDLVLMDVQMPEIDGLEATREIRKMEIGFDGRLPIIAMTAHAMKGDRENCLAAGMDDYLCKPIRMKDIEEKLADHFADEHGPPAGTPNSTQSDFLGDVAMIDWSSVLVDLGNDQELLNDLVKTFLDATPSMVSSAKACLDQDNLAGLKQSAHTIKGAISFLQLSQTIKTASELEQYSAMENRNAAGNAFNQLQAQLGSVYLHLQKYLNNQS